MSSLGSIKKNVPAKAQAPPRRDAWRRQFSIASSISFLQGVDALTPKVQTGFV
jgi:hypothetical protein